MKHLLLPLLAALALPTAVLSGDLGVADFNLDRVIKLGPKRRIKYQETSESDVINFNCGGIGTHMKKCLIEFKNGLLIVDGSRGIKPSQIKHLSFATASVQGLYIYVIYADSNNKLAHAGFGSIDLRQAAGFQTRFLNWMNSDK